MDRREKRRVILERFRQANSPEERRASGATRKLLQFDAEEDEWFEQMAIAMLDSTPTAAWSAQPESVDGRGRVIPGRPLALWGVLDQANLSTRKRILVHALDLCGDRGDPLPGELRQGIKKALGAAKARRNRAHAPCAQLRAALLIAANPAIGDMEIARKVKALRQTVEAWRTQPRFNALVEKASAKRNLRPRESNETAEQYYARRAAYESDQDAVAARLEEERLLVSGKSAPTAISRLRNPAAKRSGTLKGK